MDLNVNLTAHDVTRIHLLCNKLIEREKGFTKLFNDYKENSLDTVKELEFIKSKLVENPINDKANYSPKINREYCGLKGSEEVLNFIQNFLAHNNSTSAEDILKFQFNEGYCYHFAALLKGTFDRGQVCWCAPFGHMCWMDEDGVPYDIYGICVTEAEYFVPVSYLGRALNDFLRTGNPHDTSIEEIQYIKKKYLSTHRLRYKVEFTENNKSFKFDEINHVVNYINRVVYNSERSVPCYYNIKGALINNENIGYKYTTEDRKVSIEIEDIRGNKNE